MRKREGAGGDVFTGNDRNAAEPVPCYARRVRVFVSSKVSQLALLPQGRVEVQARRTA